MAATGARRKQEVNGPPVDSVFKNVIHNDTMQRVPLLNRGNLKAQPVYWNYVSPASLFSPEDRLAIIGGNTSHVNAYSAKISEWCASVQYLVNDLQLILRSKYYKFWSAVLFDYEFHQALDSYLRAAPRWFDPNFLVTPLMESVQDELHDAIMKIFMRMSTWRESRTDHLTPAKFSESLKREIYDIARIADLCVLYGYADDAPMNPLLRKIMGSVLNRQPELIAELPLFIKATLDSMESVQDVCFNKDPIAPAGQPSLLAAASLLESASLKSLDDHALFDFAQGSVEIAVSVMHLMQHIPNEYVEFFNSVVNAFPKYFETVFPALDEELERRKSLLIGALGDQIREMLRAGQCCALEAFRYLVRVECLEVLSSDRLDDAEVLKVVEGYYAMMMQAVEEVSFIVAYNSLYPLSDDLDVFRTNRFTKDLVDESQFQYLLQTVQTAMSEVGLEANVLGEPVDVENGAVGGYPPEVEAVLAIMPDLRPEFIEKCLEFYHQNMDEVVSALMDNNIHPELEKWREATSAAPAKNNESEDNVHIGKKNQFDRNFLDDRQAKESVRSVVLQYSQTYDEVELHADEKMYDDEYDDTYDSVDVGLIEKDSEESDRVFEVPRILQKNNERRKAGWELVQDAEGEENEEAAERRRKAFCEDPEVVRARREQRYHANLARRGVAPRPPRDVVGVSRGQGQSHDVLRNRQLKERNKGGNRKTQSDRKRKEF